MIKCPCKGCEKREIGCHSKCEPYIAFQKDNDERRTAIQNQKKADSFSCCKYYQTASGYWKKRNQGGQN